jgi:hypothetical protein
VVATGALTEPFGKLIVQVSRWDRLKDMHGVMAGFASAVVGRIEAQLLLIGPSVEGVGDDPEGSDVLAECIATWQSLSSRSRDRIRLISLPMDVVPGEVWKPAVVNRPGVGGCFSPSEDRAMPEKSTWRTTMPPAPGWLARCPQQNRPALSDFLRKSEEMQS